MAKNFEFINASAKREFMDLPEDIRLQFSTDLNAVCQDKDPFSDFKNISGSVGVGAIELIENGSPAYRTVYCAKYMDTVFILHSFTKTTNGVDQRAMKTAAKRHQLMMERVRKAEAEAKRLAKQAIGNVNRSNKLRKKRRR